MLLFFVFVFVFDLLCVWVFFYFFSFCLPLFFSLPFFFPSYTTLVWDFTACWAGMELGLLFGVTGGGQEEGVVCSSGRGTLLCGLCSCLCVCVCGMEGSFSLLLLFRFSLFVLFLFFFAMFRLLCSRFLILVVKVGGCLKWHVLLYVVLHFFLLFCGLFLFLFLSFFLVKAFAACGT